MSAGRTVALRLVVTVVVATLVVAVAGIVPFLGPSPGGDGGVPAVPEQTEWRASNLDPARIDNGGEADPSGDVGVVLIDNSHSNRFDTEDIAPLVEAINDAGGEVQFTSSTADIETELNDADVLVVIDPEESYNSDEVGEIEQFVEDGGRVLLVGEPNRKEIQQTGFFAALVTERTRLDSLGSAFGVSFGTQYVYDMENNDGNFKNVVTSPPSGTSAAAVQGVGRVTMYTAATVSVNRGTVLLRTAGTAERAGEDATTGFPVAVLAADGDVLAVGDKTFLSDQYHAVADNELFIQRIVEFMTAADHQPSDVGNETEAPVAPAIGRPAG